MISDYRKAVFEGMWSIYQAQKLVIIFIFNAPRQSSERNIFLALSEGNLEIIIDKDTTDYSNTCFNMRSMRVSPQSYVSTSAHA